MSPQQQQQQLQHKSGSSPLAGANPGSQSSTPKLQKFNGSLTSSPLGAGAGSPSASPSTKISPKGKGQQGASQISSTAKENGSKKHEDEGDQSGEADHDQDEAGEEHSEDNADNFEEEEEEGEEDEEDATTEAGTSQAKTVARKTAPVQGGGGGESGKVVAPGKVWKVGARCQARYSADGQWYGATIVAVVEGPGRRKGGEKGALQDLRYRVRYVEYEGEEVLSSTSLRLPQETRRSQEDEDDSEESSGKKRKKARLSAQIQPSLHSQQFVSPGPMASQHARFFPHPHPFQGALFPPQYQMPPSPYAQSMPGGPYGAQYGVGSMLGGLPAQSKLLPLFFFFFFFRAAF